MNTKRLRILAGLTFVLAPCVSRGQAPSVPSFEKLPDWGGLWSMMGGTVFDTTTQTGKGGVVTHGVREHPPYTPAFEKIYDDHLALRDADRFPDVLTNCGVPVGYPRILNPAGRLRVRHSAGYFLHCHRERPQHHAGLYGWAQTPRQGRHLGNLHWRFCGAIGRVTRWCSRPSG